MVVTLKPELHFVEFPDLEQVVIDDWGIFPGCLYLPVFAYSYFLYLPVGGTLSVVVLAAAIARLLRL